MSTSLDVGMELRQAKRVVQPLVDGAFADEPVVMGLTTLGHHDEFTYMHAVNTGMVAVTIGHFLGLDRRTLSDLAVASLLHDAGKGAVGDQVKHPFDAWTSEDRAAAERHPIEGARQIARATVLSATSLRCMRVALEHHAGPNGYPALDDWTPSVLSQIVAVADCYVSLLGHRSARGRAVTPYDAIGMMLGPLASRFEPAMLWALVRSVGLYPPGQVVKLEDGSIAVVLLPNRDDVLRPHARVIVGPHGEWLGEEGAFDHRPLPRNLPVKRALSAEEYPKPPEARAA
jgi:HD-GYP domain-containing protein (c-di-GMP phosphodiesterase class II)